MTEIEKMHDGKLYNPLDKALVKGRLRAMVIADRFNRTPMWNEPRRNRLISKLLPNCGANVNIKSNFRVDYGFNITIGKNFFANFDCILLDGAPIKIGDDVLFGPRVVLATPNHCLWPEQRVRQQHEDGIHDLEFSRPITIGNNVWVAAGAVICGGVTIGDNSVIAAGSVVKKNIPANVLAAGVPCRVIREICESDRMDYEGWRRG